MTVYSHLLSTVLLRRLFSREVIFSCTVRPMRFCLSLKGSSLAWISQGSDVRQKSVGLLTSPEKVLSRLL